MIKQIFLALNILLVSNYAFAQSESIQKPTLQSMQNEVFSINVRAMKGSRVEPETAAFEFDQRLEDLRSQLEHLKFKRYQLLFDKTAEISLDQVESIDLVEGHKLLIQPQSHDPKKVCLWIQWKDENDNEVLDTKIHVINGHSMIAGTDSDEASGDGLILAISATHKGAGKLEE